MATKAEIERKKVQAAELLKQRPGLTAREIANLTGLSKTTARRVKADVPQSPHNGAKAQATTAAPEGIAPNPDPKTPLDFEESPDPPEKKGILDEAMKSLKGMLGIGDKQESKAAPVLSAKLDPRRQAFVDSASPTVSLAAMALAAWLWGRIGPEYSMLAPDEKVAQRIVEPLLRIYARHAQFMTDINPDVADVGASMFALVAYVHVSLGLYQQIKQEKEEDDYEQEQERQGYSRARGLAGHWRGRRYAPENTASHTGDRYADVSGDGGANGHVNGANGRDTGGVDLSHLSDKEAEQYARLSRLSQLDFEHRARRSGKPL